MKHNLILRVITKYLFPVIALFAFYVQFHGDYGPGGGHPGRRHGWPDGRLPARFLGCGRDVDVERHRLFAARTRVVVVERVDHLLDAHRTGPFATMQIDAGSITGLVGPNGAGKTTLVMAICGALRPATGKIIYKDSEIQGKSPNRVMEDLSTPASRS